MPKSKRRPYALFALEFAIAFVIGFVSCTVIVQHWPAMVAPPSSTTSTTLGTSSATTSALPYNYTVAAGGSFNVIAYSNPSTGFSWNVSVDNPSVVEYVGALGCVVPPPVGIVGAGCNETFGFRAISAGATVIRMRYLRSWEANSTVQTRNVSVVVGPV